MADYSLYVSVRKLNSMNPGKAQAHSGHAASQMFFAMMEKNPEMLAAWHGELGFGTQINIDIPDSDLAILEEQTLEGPDMMYMGFVIDPTYPYIVDSEVYPLISNETHTMPGIVNSLGQTIAFRKEHTATWFFGDANEMKLLLGKYPLSK